VFWVFVKQKLLPDDTSSSRNDIYGKQAPPEYVDVIDAIRQVIVGIKHDCTYHMCCVCVLCVWFVVGLFLLFGSFRVFHYSKTVRGLKDLHSQRLKVNINDADDHKLDNEIEILTQRITRVSL